MSRTSDYVRKQKADILEKFNELRSLLPSFTHPYLDGMMVDYQPNTLVAYARDLLTFFKYLQEMNPALSKIEIRDIPIEAVDSLTAQDIIEYRNYLAYNAGKNAHSNQAVSIERRMAPLRGFYSTAVELGYLKNNPTTYHFGRKRKKSEKREIVYLEKNEVRNLLDTVDKSKVASSRQRMYAEKTRLRDSAILTLMLYTGIRVSECVGIDLDDLNFTNNSVRVTRKGGADQVVYFGEKTAKALEEYISSERPGYIGEEKEKALFLSTQKKRMTARAIEYMVKKFSQEAVPEKNISPHKMRSTYGTALYDETNDIRLVADVLGHEDVTTTARHYAAAKERHRKEAGNIELY